ncbi:MAG: hypothetical protein D6B27_04880 [Gammaproteobacteria bacterium]|nr:MAG: hypothetical protein D6B27_04880 [Gammaproteobacteria bacterium]
MEMKLLLLAIAVIAFSGCGQKGPLYLNKNDTLKQSTTEPEKDKNEQ